MDIISIKNECDRLVRDYAQKFGNPDIIKDETKSVITWKIVLQTINLEFCYTLKSKMLVPISTLFCNVYLQKNAEIPYNINQVIDYLNLEDFHCYTFSYIENIERLQTCFNTLISFIDKNYDAMNSLVVNNPDFAQLRLDEAKRVLKSEDEEMVKSTGYAILYENQLVRYTDYPAYKLFLKKDYARSLRQYYKLQKKYTIYSYEKKLVAFMESLLENGETYEAVPDGCGSMLIAEQHNGTSKADAKAFLASFLMMYAAFLIPIIIIVNLLYSFYQKDTLFYSHSEPIFYSFVITLIPSIFAGISIVDNVRVLISKNKKSAREFSEILNPPKTKKAAKVITVIAVVLSLFFGFVIARPVVKCYDDYMLCDVSESIITQDFVRYNYKDITGIYHVSKVYNDYTEEYMDRESYVLVFGKEEYYTYGDFEIDEVEEKLLPQIEKYYKGKIQTVDAYKSDKT